jgi:membrane protein YdbS with pleckstrin-like domain
VHILPRAGGSLFSQSDAEVNLGSALVIPLNTPQALTPRAFWYIALRTLLVSLLALGLGKLVALGANSPHGACRGALCGTVTGSHLAGFIYLFAAFLAVRALVNFRSLSFVLTDKNISISSGVLFRNSCTIRFDRIQDVRLLRNPLHLILGLKSVAIWTASPDQRIGNSKRPDGLLVLDAGEADWLRDYLSDPGQGARQDFAAGHGSAVPTGAARAQASTGIGAFAAVGGIVALAIVALWHGTPSSTSASPTSAPSAPTSADSLSAASAGGTSGSAAPSSRPDVERSSPVTHPLNPQFALVCAIHQGSPGGMTACSELGEARRCQQESGYPSQPTQEAAVFTIANRSREPVKFFWLDRSGVRALYATLPPGGHVDQQTHVGAHWLVSTVDGRCVGIFNAATMAIGIY